MKQLLVMVVMIFIRFVKVMGNFIRPKLSLAF